MVSTAQDQSKDHWSSEAYSASAAFVPKLTQTLLKYLDPQPTDKVLDIGCGDGKFTETFLPHVNKVLGVDASPSMIQSANEDYAGEKAEFRVLDCCYLEQDTSVANGTWDKVVSNAALHWILRNESTRMSALRGVYASLRPGGTFAFEMGGHGNVAEVTTALMYALLRQGVPFEKVRAADPWFFPSANWMTEALESIGFKVTKMETEYRPTLMTSSSSGGLPGWVRLMGASFLDALAPEKREATVQEICDVLQSVVTRVEDGSQWLGYVRLRGVAQKI
ncbi:S-adenosyl-L-methionine-dependent methyltransferase [Aspergillus egyptiacus]|nr:S-adenosyl-L-methionine-dependent methyltransferase [Aspergillus egyptiacus]